MSHTVRAHLRRGEAEAYAAGGHRAGLRYMAALFPSVVYYRGREMVSYLV